MISGADSNRNLNLYRTKGISCRSIGGGGGGGGDKYELTFEIVKNAEGAVVIPHLPVGNRIDTKILLKSIAPTGTIYLRLLEDPIDAYSDMTEFVKYDTTKETTGDSDEVSVVTKADTDADNTTGSEELVVALP